MAYNTVVAGTTITAAWGNQARDQQVSTFASPSARNSAVTAPVEGMLTHQADENSLTSYTGSQWAYTLYPAHGALVSWTPTVTQSGSVTVTVARAVYTRTGRWIEGECTLNVTGSGTGSNAVVISLPATAAGTGVATIVGNGFVYDNSASAKYYGVAVLHSTTSMKLANSAADSYNDSYLGLAASAFTAGLASPDIVSVHFSYEAAADS